MKRANPDKELVVLMHGIGHSMINLYRMELRLKRAGYETLNLTYPSLRHRISDLSLWLRERLQEKQVWITYHKVHFVAHSMGGLVSGFYLQDYKEDIPVGKLGRVVMLSTPHGGSEVADALKDLWLYKFVFGPAGQELTTDQRPSRQISPYYELGIIAGTKHWLYPLGMRFIPALHDGCVSVKNTKLKGMSDHIALPVLHGFMGWNKQVCKQAQHFLENGGFDHGA